MTVPTPPAAGGASARAEAFVQQHRTELLAGGGALVAALAFWRKRAAGKAAPADPAATPPAATISGYAPQGGGGVYSSGVNDFYDAIQPTLEQIQQQINKLNATPPGPTKALPPVPVVVKPSQLPTRPILVRPPAPAPKPQPKAPVLQRYVVRPGDNLSKIADQFGLPGGRSTGWKSLYGANQAAIGGNPNMIKPGTTLVIPQR